MKVKYVVFLVISVSVLGAIIFVAQSRRTNSVLVPDSSIEAMLGDLFIVGIPGTTLDDATRESLVHIQPRAIVLYRRNYDSPERFHSLITDLQALARGTTKRPYEIMIDEEPGGVSRLGLFRRIFDTGKPNWDVIRRDLDTMRELGVTIDLAPIADYPFTQNSFIAQRNQSHTIPAMTDFNKKFIATARAAGIATTLKHFPGMGIFVDDPHYTVPMTSGDEFLDSSLAIFESGIRAGVPYIMTAHGRYNSIDPDNPVTLSKIFVTDILRNRLKFKGLIMTDDLSDMPFLMGQDMSVSDATITALDAGHNLVMFSHNLSRTEKLFDTIVSKAHSDPSVEAVIRERNEEVRDFYQKLR